jgi:REP element-mobilizing transposase RayT
LHRAEHGPKWIADPSVAEKIAENLHRLDGDAYRLDSFSIMSNHVHTVFKPFVSDSQFLTLIRWDGLTPIDRYPGLSKIMHSLKGRTARERNLIIGRTGSFWEHESFDHVIRQGKFDKTILYVLNNPVKAGLVDYWEDWRWNYCRGEILDRFRKK